MEAKDIITNENRVKIIPSAVGDNTAITALCCCDYDLKLFEEQYELPEGMTYDSYIIDDESPVVMDAVDSRVEREWREAVASYLHDRAPGRSPSYLVVQHLEPDHSGAIEGFMKAYPECKLVCSIKAAGMLHQFASGISPDRVIAVKDGDSLEIGRRTLRFYMAPMVHWPEVMVTYDPCGKVLFSADAFGTFGTSLATAVSEGKADRQLFEAEWPAEARRYYINICGKYGAQVQSLLKKASALDIDYLCPLHGPVIDLRIYNPVSLYDIWSRYEPENPRKCFIPAASLHGNTVEAAHRLASMLGERGLEAEVADLSETPLSQAVSLAAECGCTVFMSATYDASMAPEMRDFISRLLSKGWHKRTAAVVENGSWAPISGRLILAELQNAKDVTVIEPTVTIKTRLDDDSEAALGQLADNIKEALS